MCNTREMTLAEKLAQNRALRESREVKLYEMSKKAEAVADDENRELMRAFRVGTDMLAAGIDEKVITELLMRHGGGDVS